MSLHGLCLVKVEETNRVRKNKIKLAVTCSHIGTRSEIWGMLKDKLILGLICVNESLAVSQFQSHTEMGEEDKGQIRGFSLYFEV